jgi:hypothetical protein
MIRIAFLVLLNYQGEPFLSFFPPRSSTQRVLEGCLEILAGTSICKYFFSLKSCLAQIEQGDVHCG